jgi:hypothetical protein
VAGLAQRLTDLQQQTERGADAMTDAVATRPSRQALAGLFLAAGIFLVALPMPAGDRQKDLVGTIEAPAIVTDEA